MLRRRHWIRSAALLATTVVLTAANGQNPPAGRPYHFVTDTRPPDAYLALRSLPSGSDGRRIEKMANGTLLEVLQQRGDGWWRVRVVESGLEGWALSHKGDRVWIACCKSEATSAAPSIDTKFRTPAADSVERIQILEAARRAQNTTVKFKVNYLTVFDIGDNAIAVADLQDTKGLEPYGGLMFFNMKNGQWRALYSMYMDGSESCERTIKISEEMLAYAKRLDAPQWLFPQSFYTGYSRAVSEFRKKKDQSDCSTTARY